jgi:hypothetical protein
MRARAGVPNRVQVFKDFARQHPNELNDRSELMNEPFSRIERAAKRTLPLRLLTMFGWIICPKAVKCSGSVFC